MIVVITDSTAYVGLDEENLSHLNKGLPVRIFGKHIGLEKEVMIFFGKDSDDLRQILKDRAGLNIRNSPQPLHVVHSEGDEEEG